MTKEEYSQEMADFTKKLRKRVKTLRLQLLIHVASTGFLLVLTGIRIFDPADDSWLLTLACAIICGFALGVQIYWYKRTKLLLKCWGAEREQLEAN